MIRDSCQNLFSSFCEERNLTVICTAIKHVDIKKKLYAGCN